MILLYFVYLLIVRKDVGKEKTNDKEPCHAKIRPIAADTPQTAFYDFLFKGDTFFLE